LDAIRRRENALTVGCVASHDGKPCERGGLVGSERAVAQYEALKKSPIDLGKLELVRTPAFDAYYGSLVNLGIFKWTEKAPSDESPHEEGGEEDRPRSVDDLELTDLGLGLAQDYESMVGSLSAVTAVASRPPVTSARALSELGKRAGLCELAGPGAKDRERLRAMFFNTDQDRKQSHLFRRSSLLLLLELVRQLEENEAQLSAAVFADAVYHDACLLDDGTLLQFQWPEQLADIVRRWRMFYCHYYLSVSLESLLVCVLSALQQAGLRGLLFADVATDVVGTAVSSELSNLLGVAVPNSFIDATPEAVFRAMGINVPTAAMLDSAIDAQSVAAEWRFERHLRDRSIMPSSDGAALALMLFSVVVGRYAQWSDTDYGKWLANCVDDPYLDTCPPVVLNELERHFSDWWTTPWRKLALFVISRFVIRQHEALAYERSRAGAKALLEVDGDRVRVQGNYDEIGVSNPRFNNAVLILKDLALLEDKKDLELTVLTKEGRAYLATELRRKMKP
jgi:hypothetical protein